MAIFARCDSIVGGTTLLERDPPLLTLHDVIYVPLGDPSSRPGIFDHGQKLVLQSWYFRGERSLAQAQDLSTPYSPERLGEIAPDPVYIYGGWLHNHFGHFLLSSLSRYWSDVASRNPSTRILVHSDIPIDEWFARPWFASLFQALQIDRDRVIRLDRAMRVDTLLLPAPAMEEENFVHRAYARMGNRLGRIIAAPHIADPDDRPVYLSKARLRHGVQTLVNEDALTDMLERHGVEIVFPETLPFERQVALWYNRPIVASFQGSSLHASIFAPARSMIVLCYADTVMSNYVLVDRANNNSTTYLRPGDGQIESLGSGDGFNTRYRAADPRAAADTILRAFDFELRASASRRDGQASPSGSRWSYPPASPRWPGPAAGLVNVALDRPARMSSTHPWVPHHSISATSGRLTGSYQFHTDKEQDPWWEVELERDASVTAIRLFNRTDNAQERCGRFQLQAHAGDGVWRTLHRQDEPLVFGGLDGEPFCWTTATPIRMRVVRITLLGLDYLHLDQVEIIGRYDPRPDEPVADTRAPRALPLLKRLFGPRTPSMPPR